MIRLAMAFVVSLGWLAGCDVRQPPRERASQNEEDAPKPLAQSAAFVANLLAAPAAEASACPPGMALVEGQYCPDVQLNCLRYLDGQGRYEHFRCAEYGASSCRSAAKRPVRYCIDRHEYVPEGESLPANFRSFTHAEETCGSLGKRVCLESEWNFACEGEAMQPYPYGFKRDADACNADRADILSQSGQLRDLRAPPGSHPGCSSPFGVMDLSGNLEEFVAIDGARPVRPAMKGAYWQPGRNFCRAAQTAHDRYYNGTETGFRCCRDAH